MHLEVEQTARLSKDEYDTLQKYLERKFKKTGSYQRFMVRFFKDKIDVKESLDIKYKWTNETNQLVVKKGSLGSQSRQEMNIELGEKNQLQQFVQLYLWLGYQWGLGIYREIVKYENETVEISLVTAPDDHYFFEVEALERENKKKALADVAKFFEEIKMKPMTKLEYQTFKRFYDRTVNLRFKLADFPAPLLQTPFWKEKAKLIGFSNEV